MPFCACYHDFTRESEGLGRPLQVEDVKGLLAKALGLRNGKASLEVLDLLRKRIVIDLSPMVDECYALGPYKVKDGDTLVSAPSGDAVNKAKYWDNQDAVATIASELAEFAQRHPKMKSVAAVTAPPRSTLGRVNIPRKWAQAVANALGANVAEVDWKTQPTGAQKNREGSVADNMSVAGPIEGDVLVIDDTLRSGSTLKEVGRALRQVGAQRVYGLCVAKTMEGIARNPDGTYGIVLSKERWT